MIQRPVTPGASLPGAHERTLLGDMLRDWLAVHWPVERAVTRGADPTALTVAWRGLAELGLATLGADPSEGGLREAALVLDQLGRAACPLPFAGRVVATLATLDLGADGMPAPELGGASCCWAFGPLEPDTGMGVLDIVGRTTDGSPRVSGTLHGVDGALAADGLLAVVDDARPSLVWIDLHAAGVARPPDRALGADGWWCKVDLRDVPTRSLAADRSTMADALRLTRLLNIARAHGAARRAFDLVVTYAGERRQFGRPIGSFQAIQHKLADAMIALEGTRVLLDAATQAFDTGDARWRDHAAAAVAHAAVALRRVSLETQHAFGAVGYAEEHEAPRHFRRAHLDCIAHGGAAAARRELAARILDDGAGLPVYDLGDAANAFRERVRAWLAQHWSGEHKAAFDARPFHDREFDTGFAQSLGTTGWLGLDWPIELGGQGRGAFEQIAFLEEMERAGAPARYGASVQAHALIHHGTTAQQQRYLPEILRGEAMHGMGYSEPEAGSDLASLRTRAVRVHDEARGEHWRIDGQKIWTTTWWGRYMFLAARTDRDATPPHAGISMFIVPMSTPGITVRPATTMYDGSFANIFYDDVRVPLDALIGPENGGWKVLTDALANERGLIGGGIVIKVAAAFERLCADLRALPGRAADPLVRDRIATLAAEIEVGRRLMILCAEQAAGGPTPPAVAAISKVWSGELMERLGEASLDLLGARAALSQGAAGALRDGRYEQALRHSLMWVISIGTNEIQRSLIAQRGLGLPRQG